VELETLTVADQALQNTPDDRRSADRELAAHALAGSDAAWDRILSEHYEEAYKLAYSLTRNVPLAEDLLHTTFLKVRQNLGQYRGECGLGGWILKILHNRFRDDLKYRRRRASDTSMDDMEESDTFWLDAARSQGREDPAEAWVARMDLERALAQLGDEEHDAYALMMVGGYTSEEAGKLLGVAASTMRSRLARAKERLANLLPAYGEEDAC
jgi:RNA polymerase sigma-70 factor (ECF subfamily)